MYAGGGGGRPFGAGGMGIRGTSNDTTQSGKDATLTAFGLGGTNNYGGQGGDLGGAGVGKKGSTGVQYAGGAAGKVVSGSGTVWEKLGTVYGARD